MEHGRGNDAVLRMIDKRIGQKLEERVEIQFKTVVQ